MNKDSMYIDRKYFCIVLIMSLMWNTAFSEVTLIAPVNNMNLSSIATSFRVKSSIAGNTYILQVSNDASFITGVIEKTTNERDKYGNVFFFAADFKLAAGVWYWRVSDEYRSSWSQTWKVTVNTDLPETPPERIISPQHPLFHNRLRSGSIILMDDIQVRLRDLVPDDLKDYIVLDIPTSFQGNLHDLTTMEYCSRINNAGYYFFYDLGRPDFITRMDGRAVALSEVEWVFQNCKYCAGAATSELFYEYFSMPLMHEFSDGVLELCRKYGKHFVFGDMSWGYNKWLRFANDNNCLFSRKHFGRYWIPCNKVPTDPQGVLINWSAIAGMRITGFVDNFGGWADTWYGGNNRPGNKVPFIDYMRTYILSISMGGCVTAMEPSLQWGPTPNDNSSRYMLPFYRAVIQHGLIPGKEAVIRKIKAAALIAPGEVSNKVTYNGDIYENFIRSTYNVTGGFKDDIWPNSSRYYIVPVICQVAANNIPSTIQTRTLSQLNSTQSVHDFLDALYPVKNSSSSNAWVVDVDNSLFIVNSNEILDDTRQSYKLTLGSKHIFSMEGNIHLLQYIIGKRKNPASYWFQANSYVQTGVSGGNTGLPEYPTEITFTSTREPVLTVDPPVALVTKTWNEQTKQLYIKLSHQTGAVNFSIEIQ